jgi:3-methyladenine DNA glycosylase/8-oxoguanine DNA glycosylase
VYEAAVITVLAQLVTSEEAQMARRRLLWELGEDAPGPVPLRLLPEPKKLLATPYWTLHRLGVERRRAETLYRVALHAGRLEETVGMEMAAAYQRLTAITGLGEWSAAEIALVALGDRDAVAVGDYHLPHLVSWALAGEERGSDARMLELLEPYRGHRGRVLRLLVHGHTGYPQRGPKHAVRRLERM